MNEPAASPDAIPKPRRRTEERVMLKKPSERMVRALGTPAVGSGRNQRRLRQGRPGIESLEERALMSAFDESGDAVGLSRAAVNSTRLVQRCPPLGRSW